MILAQIASAFAPFTMLVVAMAPGFTNAFISCPLYCSTATIELNTWPVASTPIVFSICASPASCSTSARVKTLEIDWIENRAVDVADGVDVAVHGDQRDAEERRRYLGERRDVVGVLPLVERRVLCVRRAQRGIDVGLRRTLRRGTSHEQQAEPRGDPPDRVPHGDTPPRRRSLIAITAREGRGGPPPRPTRSKSDRPRALWRRRGVM